MRGWRLDVTVELDASVEWSADTVERYIGQVLAVCGRVDRVRVNDCVREA